MARRPRVPDAAKSNVRPDDFVACFTEYSEKMAEIARVRQSIGAMFKRYHPLGVEAPEIKYSYAMAGKDDIAAVHARRTRALAILGLIDWDQNGQASFAQALDTEQPSPAAKQKLALGRCKAAGYNDGLAGGPVANCPHPTGSEEFVLWRDGWEQGHADRLAKNPGAAHEKPADTRRGRRKAPDADGTVGHA